MKSKGETGHCLEMFVRSARNIPWCDVKVCYLCTAQCCEFTTGDTVKVLKSVRTELQLCCPDTLEHNGVT